ncbi:MAG: hypothetical protein SFT81_06325 [Candidatus Caenarcaniphilales bacterium]|nr:hypothetical protein [Candidatus Caenarcaniphilales bacterium]
MQKTPQKKVSTLAELMPFVSRVSQSCIAPYEFRINDTVRIWVYSCVIPVSCILRKLDRLSLRKHIERKIFDKLNTFELNELKYCELNQIELRLTAIDKESYQIYFEISSDRSSSV